MANSRFKAGLAGALCAVLLIAGIGFTQTGGLRRENGIIIKAGTFIELTAGATVVAGNALYLDSNGKVQKLTSAQAANFIGIAYKGGASGDTIQVQITGVATAICDGNWVINDKVGGTGLTPAGALKTLASTAALGSGALTGTVTTLTGTASIGAGGTTVTSTAANGAIGTSALSSGALTGTVTTLTVNGDNPGARPYGRAITACTDTGTGSLLLSPTS